MSKQLVASCKEGRMQFLHKEMFAIGDKMYFAGLMPREMEKEWEDICDYVDGVVEQYNAKVD